MTPRLMRALLVLTALSLLVVPTGSMSQAQDADREIVIELTAGDADSCTVGETHVGGQRLPITTAHERCTGGAFGPGFDFSIEATRLTPDARVLRCEANDVAGSVGFSTRETTAEGRGFIQAAPHFVIPGQLRHGTETQDVMCRLRIFGGTFHRIGTVALGRLTIDLHTEDDPGTNDPFRHVYCARFDATAVPMAGEDGGTLVTALVEGRGCDDPRDPDDDMTHGRLLADDADVHGGRVIP